jgi:hypothetical protein
MLVITLTVVTTVSFSNQATIESLLTFN